jgi:hypothetical protein
MTREGHLTVIKTNGRLLKRIAKLVEASPSSRKFSIYGMDKKTGQIGKRVMGDNEPFTVALSEDVLMELFWLGRLGGLGETYAIRAPFAAAVYADPRQLFYISGQKIMPTSDTSLAVEKAIETIQSSMSFDDAITQKLALLSPEEVDDYLSSPFGKPHHVLTFDVTYLDIGLSKNFVNNTYKNVSDGFPISRGNIKPYAHLFLVSKMALVYDAPSLQTTLYNEIKYMHTNLDEKPEKDKVRLGLRLRLPWERSYFEGEPVVIAPLFRTEYETKITPHYWAQSDKIKPRTRRFDSLLGVNADFTKLGFNVDVGALMAANLNTKSVDDALDFGPGFQLLGKWNLFGPVELSTDISGYYYFSMPKNTVLKKLIWGVEGTIWLRLARFYDFSFDVVNDFLIATMKSAPRDVVLSSIFGVTISYGRLFRLFG